MCPKVLAGTTQLPFGDSLRRRGRTALHRTAPSRPVLLATDHELIRPADTVLDFGCGHGADVRFLRASGYTVQGYDPVHGPFETPKPAEVVNLFFVVNVIESPSERVEVLRQCWALARRVLIVAARLENELPSGDAVPYEDGLSTGIGTFQKFYSHAELGAWVASTLQARVEALGPGVYAAFRSESDAAEFESRRFRRRYLALPDNTAAFMGANGALLDEIQDFAQQRGRLPTESELTNTEPLIQAFGSARRGLSAIGRRIGDAAWAKAERARTEDLVITIALARFSGRPALGRLPADMQTDIRAFFTSYSAACALADELLFALGSADLVQRARRQSKLGKLTPKALYVHRDWLSHLSPVLRLYEGCARAWLGAIEGELIKLHYDAAAVSYLSYPEFNSDAHPRLREATTVGLKRQTFSVQSFEGRMAVPILHRKERFISADDPRHAAFAKLTEQEEKAGLFEDTTRIGLSTYWEKLLADKQLVVRGHRLQKVRAKAQAHG